MNTRRTVHAFFHKLQLYCNIPSNLNNFDLEMHLNSFQFGTVKHIPMTLQRVLSKSIDHQPLHALEILY